MIQEKTPAGAESAKAWKPTSLMFYAVVGAAVLFLVWAISSTVAASGAKQATADAQTASAKTLASAKASYESQLLDANKAGLAQTAQGVAASLAPFVALQGQVPEITNRSIQSAVRNLVKDRNLRFVAVTDPSGNVIAASDLTLVGRPIAAPSGMTMAKAMIGAAPGSGTVSLGMPQ